MTKKRIGYPASQNASELGELDQSKFAASRPLQQQTKLSVAPPSNDLLTGSYAANRDATPNHGASMPQRLQKSDQQPNRAPRSGPRDARGPSVAKQASDNNGPRLAADPHAHTNGGLPVACGAAAVANGRGPFVNGAILPANGHGPGPRHAANGSAPNSVGTFEPTQRAQQGTIAPKPTMAQDGVRNNGGQKQQQVARDRSGIATMPVGQTAADSERGQGARSGSGRRGNGRPQQPQGAAPNGGRAPPGETGHEAVQGATVYEAAQQHKEDFQRSRRPEKPQVQRGAQNGPAVPVAPGPAQPADGAGMAAPHYQQKGPRPQRESNGPKRHVGAACAEDAFSEGGPGAAVRPAAGGVHYGGQAAGGGGGPEQNSGHRQQQGVRRERQLPLVQPGAVDVVANISDGPVAAESYNRDVRAGGRGAKDGRGRGRGKKGGDAAGSEGMGDINFNELADVLRRATAGIYPVQDRAQAQPNGPTVASAHRAVDFNANSALPYAAETVAVEYRQRGPPTGMAYSAPPPPSQVASVRQVTPPPGMERPAPPAQYNPQYVPPAAPVLLPPPGMVPTVGYVPVPPPVGTGFGQPAPPQGSGYAPHMYGMRAPPPPPLPQPATQPPQTQPSWHAQMSLPATVGTTSAAGVALPQYNPLQAMALQQHAGAGSGSVQYPGTGASAGVAAPAAPALQEPVQRLPLYRPPAAPRPEAPVIQQSMPLAASSREVAVVRAAGGAQQQAVAGPEYATVAPLAPLAGVGALAPAVVPMEEAAAKAKVEEAISNGQDVPATAACAPAVKNDFAEKLAAAALAKMAHVKSSLLGGAGAEPTSVAPVRATSTNGAAVADKSIATPAERPYTFGMTRSPLAGAPLATVPVQQPVSVRPVSALGPALGAAMFGMPPPPPPPPPARVSPLPPPGPGLPRAPSAGRSASADDIAQDPSGGSSGAEGTAEWREEQEKLRPRLVLQPRSATPSGRDEDGGTAAAAAARASERRVEEPSNRPRLLLQPRSKPVDTPSEVAQKSALFGAARPREEVLRQRGSVSPERAGSTAMASQHRAVAAVVAAGTGGAEGAGGSRAASVHSGDGGVDGGDQWQTVRAGRHRQAASGDSGGGGAGSGVWNQAVAMMDDDMLLGSSSAAPYARGSFGPAFSGSAGGAGGRGGYYYGAGAGGMRAEEEENGPIFRRALPTRSGELF